MSGTSESLQTNKRILVLGSAPHTRQVTAYPWDNLPDHLNVADYNAVILNFCPLQDNRFENKQWQKNFPSKEQFIRLIFSEGSEIIAIGTPRQENRSTGWLPINPEFLFESGEAIQWVESGYEYYFDHVRKWSFQGSAKNFITLEATGLAREVDPQGDHLALRIILSPRISLNTPYLLD